MPQIKELSERLEKQRRETEEKDTKRRAEKVGYKYLDLISVHVPTEIKAMALVPEAEAKEALATPLQIVRKKLVLAVFDPELAKTKALIEKLKKNYELEVVVVSKTALVHAWEYYQYVAPEGGEISGRVEINKERLEGFEKTLRSLEDLGGAIKDFESPYTSELLEIFLAGAMALSASDIHLEPLEQKGVLRLRIDGLLHNVSSEIEKQKFQSVVTRIKLLSNLKLNIHDRPQDGRFTISIGDRDIEIRTSIIPSEYGETAVLRILDPASLKVNLEELGWRKDDLAIVKREIEKPNGLILNTGPTGSGKTTTLYAFLRKITTPEVKIITIEDPIEYHLPGISQTQVDQGSGYTFASGLRSILRQDPDVILVGEVRDKETSEIALNASLTGHLVFSTLHTNDAVGAIPRLIDLGAKPQVLGPALTLVIAQRLVRVLCPKCKTEKKIDEKLKARIEKFLAGLPERVNKKDYQKPKIYAARGCKSCGNLGYRGRTSIFELFVVSEKIEEAIYKNPTELELKSLAKEESLVTMQEDGVLKVLKGITSVEEVERLTGPLPESGLWASAKN
ncbi:MAG: type II/IV secretion system protein [Candidatus Brennerbacteria bacterium]|nr:type II/IV secretion system protein [Candidatus Brennerbacteria bacterium]